jgi:hypothetical protein
MISQPALMSQPSSSQATSRAQVIAPPVPVIAMKPRLHVHTGAFAIKEHVAFGSHCACVHAEAHFIALHTKPAPHGCVESHSGAGAGLLPASPVGATLVVASMTTAASVVETGPGDEPPPSRPLEVPESTPVDASMNALFLPASSSVSSSAAFTPASLLVTDLPPSSRRQVLSIL